MAQGWDPGVEPPWQPAKPASLSARARMTGPRARARECVGEGALSGAFGALFAASERAKLDELATKEGEEVEGHGTVLTAFDRAGTGGRFSGIGTIPARFEGAKTADSAASGTRGIEGHGTALIPVMGRAKTDGGTRGIRPTWSIRSVGGLAHAPRRWIGESTAKQGGRRGESGRGVRARAGARTKRVRRAGGRLGGAKRRGRAHARPRGPSGAKKNRGSRCGESVAEARARAGVPTHKG